MGGTDDSSNLLKLTVEEHAEAHKILYEKYGHWQDYSAWKGLSKQMTHLETIRYVQRMSMLGKKAWNKGIPNTNQQKQKISEKLSKTWEIVYPDGRVTQIQNMDKFCKQNGLFKSNMYKVAYGKQKHHRGFSCKEVTFLPD
jgi:hypothetical protein